MYLSINVCLLIESSNDSPIQKEIVTLHMTAYRVEIVEISMLSTLYAIEYAVEGNVTTS